MSTVHSAAAWVVVKTFFDMNDQSLDVLELLSNPLVELSVMATGIALPVNTLLADCILVWRCWAVWNRQIKIVLLPAICAVVGAVFGLLVVGIQIRMYPVAALEKTRILVSLGTAYIVLTLVSQISAALLIIYRIFSLTLGQTRKYSHVVEMVVESAAPNCIILIIILPFFVENSSVGGSYLQTVLIHSAGIGPTLIATRVAFGIARSDDEWSRGNMVLGKASDWSSTGLTRIESV
ncbi:hypothetical protein DFH08DRAFT_975012 [Mycena albidolilacea]|uniref:Uncharacterized protein n=1 Tax=Mycena albidolilacea TaxID=1033008 RepID=A0AAD6Z5R6_9AGAR|nr:hypothetical protein DFH08DRAFT_975012 [Mycena albidolilacea]